MCHVELAADSLSSTPAPSWLLTNLYDYDDEGVWLMSEGISALAAPLNTAALSLCPGSFCEEEVLLRRLQTWVARRPIRPGRRPLRTSRRSLTSWRSWDRE